MHAGLIDCHCAFHALPWRHSSELRPTIPLEISVQLKSFILCPESYSSSRKYIQSLIFNPKWSIRISDFASNRAMLATCFVSKSGRILVQQINTSFKLVTFLVCCLSLFTYEPLIPWRQHLLQGCAMIVAPFLVSVHAILCFPFVSAKK